MIITIDARRITPAKASWNMFPWWRRKVSIYNATVTAHNFGTSGTGSAWQPVWATAVQHTAIFLDGA